MTRLRTFLLIGLFLTAGVSAQDNEQTLFDTTDGWRAERYCRISLKAQHLHIEALAGQPQVSRLVDFTGGDFRFLLEMRTGTESQVSLYWTSKGSPRRDETNKIVLPLEEDGNWHTYEFPFNVPTLLESLMLRFSAPDGSWEIRSIKLIRKSAPPFVIRTVEPIVHKEDGKPDQEMMKFTVANNLHAPVRFKIGTQTTERTLVYGQEIDLGVPIRPEGNLAAVVLTLCPHDFPEVVCPLFLYYPEEKTKWIQKTLAGDKIIEIAPDARMARLQLGGEIFGIIAPLVHRNGVIPKFELAADSTETELRFTSDEVDLTISIAPPLVNFGIVDKSAQGDAGPLEGLAVRLFGKLQSGLLPGVEFLRPGDTSSSEIDIVKPLNNRSRPNPLWMTMPLAVLETEKGGAALYWEDAALQPTFASPNQFDRTDDHRFSLVGSTIKASLELWSPPQPQEESASFKALRAYIARKGFPPPPPAPRTAEEQRQLSSKALETALQSDAGGQWGYAMEPQWERQPFADMLSTIARLTEAGGGRARNPSAVVPGGSDITNDAVYFMSCRIREWQQFRETAIQQTMVNADGSFLFRTRFPEWETAASSYGYTALKALEVMEYVRATGNNELFASVTKALNYLKECDIPSGGFYQDTPFHTPDLQAAAALVWLYVWAYEYSGNAEYLERAKHFAFAGLPFVYQTSQTEVMLYGTVGKFGGTSRQPPLHFGMFSIDVGLQYAYALNLLSKYDSQTNWKTAALGILHTVEKLQFSEGSEAGCVPELFDVVGQERQGWKVNPCALVSLRLAIEGKVDSLCVFLDGRDRYTSSYPLRKTAQGIEAYNVPPGQKFQILLNGKRYGTGEGEGVVTVD